MRDIKHMHMPVVLLTSIVVGTILIYSIFSSKNETKDRTDAFESSDMEKEETSSSQVLFPISETCFEKVEAALPSNSPSLAEEEEEEEKPSELLRTSTPAVHPEPASTVGLHEPMNLSSFVPELNNSVSETPEPETQLGSLSDSPSSSKLIEEERETPPTTPERIGNTAASSLAWADLDIEFLKSLQGYPGFFRLALDGLADLFFRLVFS
ncbi:hypothetical protein NECID01_0240 [Nematocida sp. AWRm77]|nr:hypothetical protein NECID01_0240 [Nematocida sp. AWRm77]